MKKLVSIIVALILAAAVGLAFAAPVDVSDTYKVSSVQVSGIKEGNTLTLYKIVTFKLDTDTNEFDYDFAAGLPSDLDTIDELSALSPNGYSLEAADSTIRVAADKLANLIANGTITPIGSAVTATAGSGDTATISNLPAGYYVAVVTGTADNSIIYQHMLINAMPVVDTDNNTYKSAADISFKVKHTTESVTKGVGTTADHSAETQTTDAYTVRDRVPFEIKTFIPNYPNPSESAKFIIKDTPTNLSDDVTTVKVTVEGDDETGSAAGSIAGKFTVAAEGNGFTVTFEKDYILAHPSAHVTVNYDAVITDGALVDSEKGLTAENTASIIFNPNPNEIDEVTPEDKTEIYTYGLDVLKYEDGDTTKPLKGAEFILYAEDGTTVVRDQIAVDSNGHISWNKLKAGTYKLVEKKAPTGYKIDETPRTIVISSESATEDDRTTSGTTENYFYQIDVPNTAGVSLPSTGGIGTTIFYVVGGLLVIGAAVILVARRKVSE